MKRFIYLAMSLLLLTLPFSTAYAEKSKLKNRPVIETTVITVSAETAQSPVISIPDNVLIVRQGVPGVFVLEKNEARFRMVRPGKINANRVEILSGLFGDETLISGDLKVMFDGTPVKIIK
ncbi:MAG: hypothetical protein OEM07_04185 [Gammaproteobacteria bacterium]|nr:hypothetical protein [Gammaproteobacteria bacterium]